MCRKCDKYRKNNCTRIRGIRVSKQKPINGQTLVYNGCKWIPITPEKCNCNTNFTNSQGLKGDKGDQGLKGEDGTSFIPTLLTIKNIQYDQSIITNTSTNQLTGSLIPSLISSRNLYRVSIYCKQTTTPLNLKKNIDINYSTNEFQILNLIFLSSINNIFCSSSSIIIKTDNILSISYQINISNTDTGEIDLIIEPL